MAHINLVGHALGVCHHRKRLADVLVLAEHGALGETVFRLRPTVWEHVVLRNFLPLRHGAALVVNGARLGGVASLAAIDRVRVHDPLAVALDDMLDAHRPSATRLVRWVVGDHAVVAAVALDDVAGSEVSRAAFLGLAGFALGLGFLGGLGLLWRLLTTGLGLQFEGVVVLDLGDFAERAFGLAALVQAVLGFGVVLVGLESCLGLKRRLDGGQVLVAQAQDVPGTARSFHRCLVALLGRRVEHLGLHEGQPLLHG